jgi:hypothetical protein
MAPTKATADDARHPNTTADAGAQPPAQRSARGGRAEKAEDYGFRTIEETEPAEGPGAVEPVQHDALNVAGDNSTFASRAQRRGGNKAVQSGEGKGA